MTIDSRGIDGSAAILDRARELLPGFRDRAPAAEEARRLPQESIDEMVEAGLARLLVPARFGGDEADLTTWFEVGREIATADASHGWCASLMMHQPHYAALFPEEAQEAVWADGPDVVVAASVMPVCEVTDLGDSYSLTGRSPFASGIAGSSWVILGGFLPEPGPPQWAFFLIPPGSYEVADTWLTVGMRGTGSNTVVTDGVVVPKTRVMLKEDLRLGQTPGARVNDGVIYRAPWHTFAPIAFASSILGAAQGAYEEFRRWTVDRKAAGGRGVATFEAVQIQLGRVAATLDAADLMIRRAAQVPYEETITYRMRSRSVRDFCRASELIVESVDELMRMSGSAGYAESNPIQRAWRDVHFASSHRSLNPDGSFSNWGREEFGIEHPEHALF